MYDATTPSDPPEPSGTPAYRTAGSYTFPEVCGRFVAASASRGRTAATAGAGVLTDMMQFTLRHTDTRTEARAGELATDHGVIRTPIFMPVGTAAAVKGIFHRDVRDEAGAEIILANTYHLYLRPGTKILEEAGGVHRFSTWEGPMLTDSGGFQVFSLADCRKLREEGCHFRSHIDGSKHLFTPESVIDTERAIGADIMMAFDECPPGDAPREYAAKSLALTERWLDRCFERYAQTQPRYGHYQALFPIVQGCGYPDLRARAAENVRQYDADGYAIGGLAVGEPTEVMYRMIEVVNAILPADRPATSWGSGRRRTSWKRSNGAWTCSTA